MLAVVCVRDSQLPSGAAEVAAECAGRVLLVGSGVTEVDTSELGVEVRGLELGDFAPARWATLIAPLLVDEAVIVLPSSPDGRDLAPRLAHVLRRPFLAGAVEITDELATVSRGAGLELHTFHLRRGLVATLQPGVRDAEPAPTPAVVEVIELDEFTDVVGPDDAEPSTPEPSTAETVRRDATIVAVLPPDVATMDLSEAPRIVGGGAGLDGADRFTQLGRLAAHLGASMGATRVITDRGWIDHERQIGTTGVVVDPELYLAFGVSGAVQHTSGLGDPAHIVSVNTDPHCPMMQMADLGIVADANAVLDALEQRLDARPGGPETTDA